MYVNVYERETRRSNISDTFKSRALGAFNIASEAHNENMRTKCAECLSDHN